MPKHLTVTDVPADHAADATAVHGIADTTALALTADVNAGLATKVANAGGTPSIRGGTLALRPAAGTAGQLYLTTDVPRNLYRDTGTTWELFAVSADDIRLSDQRVPTDGSVTDTKVAVGAAIAQSKIANLATDLAAKVANAGGAPSLAEGTLALRPVAGTAGRLYLTTDSPRNLYRDTGTAWELVAVSTDDARLSDARTPSIHASSHGLGGSDALTTADLGTGTADATTFLRGDRTWAAAGGGLLAYKEYSLPAEVTTTSSTLVDVDATNLAVTFTVPASGIVVVSLTAITLPGAAEYWWGLREGAAVVATSDTFMDYNGQYTRLGYCRRFTGLTAGASKTWKWAHRASGTRGLNGGADGTRYAVMEVWAA